MFREGVSKHKAGGAARRPNPASAISLLRDQLSSKK